MLRQAWVRQCNCPKHAPHTFEPKHTDTLPLKWNACKDSLLSLSCLYWSALNIYLWDGHRNHPTIIDWLMMSTLPQWTPNTCRSARGSDWHETYAVTQARGSVYCTCPGCLMCWSREGGECKPTCKIKKRSRILWQYFPFVKCCLWERIYQKWIIINIERVVYRSLTKEK